MARVPYRDPDDLPEPSRDLVVSSLQPGKTVDVYRAVANNPPVLAGLRSFLGALWTDSGLTERERELVILAVAREVDSEYEFHQHANVASIVDVPDEDVAAIGTADLSGFDEREVPLVRYARAVVNGEVDDARFDELAAWFDDEAIAGATALAAGYGALARVIDALGVEIEDQFVGWDLGGE
jgi:alkylhydroperoxidase family enzyme